MNGQAGVVSLVNGLHVLARDVVLVAPADLDLSSVSGRTLKAARGKARSVIVVNWLGAAYKVESLLTVATFVKRWKGDVPLAPCPWEVPGVWRSQGLAPQETGQPVEEGGDEYE